MKKCPICGELLGNNADSCFNCGERWNNKTFDLKHKLITAELNDLYEYDVVYVADEESGAVDVEKIALVLSYYAKEGWRLKSTFTNEVGKKTSLVGYGGVSSGTNATIEQTVMIFERRIETAESRAKKVKEELSDYEKIIEIGNEEKRKAAEEKKAGVSGIERKILQVIIDSEIPLDVNQINEKLDNAYSVMDLLTLLQRMVEKDKIKKEYNKYYRFD